MVYIFLLLIIGITTGAVWNPSTDPLPPVQPKEVGFLIENVYNNTFVNEGVQLLDVQIFGYQLNSYNLQTVQVSSGGYNQNQAVMQFSYQNLSVPDSSTASLYAQYGSKSCSFSPSEGGTPYQGYDYYTNAVLAFSADPNTTVYFEEMYYPDYGDCLVYSVPVPWPYDSPVYPRKMNYTIIYQKSTNYLVQYSLKGTEYCCADTGTCVDQQLYCNDGSDPLLTFTTSDSYYSNYHIFDNNAYNSSSVLGAYCPFDNDNEVDTYGVRNTYDYYTETDVTTAVLITFFITAFLATTIFLLYLRMEKKSSPTAMSRSTGEGQYGLRLNESSQNSSA
jgi:hypothetical protein